MTDKSYFSAICRINKAFGTTLKKEALLDLIVENAIETMNGKGACLFLRDEHSVEDVFVPAAQKGLSENYIHAAPMSARKVVDDILKEGGYLAIKDATADPRAENHAAKKAEGIASVLVVPVMVQDTAIGVLSLYTAEPRDFSQDEIDFLFALAEQGGMAIQNTRLVERIDKNSELFYYLAANLNSSLDLNKVLHIMTAEICDAFGMKGVSIRLLNPETGTMDLVSSYGLSEEYLAKGEITAEKSELVDEALKGNVIAIRNVAQDSRFVYREAAAREGIVSMLSVPVSARGEVIGLMRIWSEKERDFPPDLIKLMQALANQGGIAITNARLVEQINDNATLFHDMADSINSSLDVRHILHILTADISESFHMKGVNIRLLNRDTGSLDLVASYGLSERFLNKGPVSQDKSVVETLQGKTVVIRDARTDPRIQYQQAMEAEGIVSMLCVPVRSRDEVIGVMRLCAGEERRFPKDLVLLVEALAHQGGIAITNASMYLALQEDKKNLEEEIWSHRVWF